MMKRFVKKVWERLGTAIVIVLVVASVAFAARMVYENLDFNGEVRFFNDVVFKSPNCEVTFEDTVTFDGASTFNAGAEFTEGVTVNSEFILKTHDFNTESGSTTYTHDIDNGNVIICSGSTESFITLPAITEAMDGYLLIVKNISGATRRNILPNAANYIESTQGTRSSTSDVTIDAVGDCAAWMANYISGSTSVWELIFTELL